MSVLASRIRKGSYADSIVLMQLQSDLERLQGVMRAGVVMGSVVNLDLLRSSELLDELAADAGPEDLIIAVRAESAEAAAEALSKVDELMQRKRSTETGDFRPRTLAAAAKRVPDCRWVSISTPGRYAHAVAREALDLGCHVFLYSDNVPLDEEVELKQQAASRQRLIMGPDCGSAMIDGIGFGFTNRVRRGPIGLVCASGTGLQAITTQIHQLGAGISHAIGTGGRDLQEDVGGVSARQGLELLARDDATEVIVLASKPPDAAVRTTLLSSAMAIEKPVVVLFSGFAAPAPGLGNLRFARSLTEAAMQAVSLLDRTEPSSKTRRQGNDGYLRGLFAGGTLAHEALQTAAPFLSPLYSNLSAEGVESLPTPTQSRGHTLLDLGADEYTVGRLHPMMDQQLRIERLRQEAGDPEVGLILLDVVLGLGAHPEPASELAPVLTEIRSPEGPQIVAIVVGTDDDPQGLQSTVDQLSDAGATVYQTVTEAMDHAITHSLPRLVRSLPSIDLNALERPDAVINVGLDSLYDDLVAQEIDVVQVDWRPPAGGNERLMSILEKMKA